MTYILTDELYHHGILGQRWGVRRFQNPDGTLTEAGKKRYGTAENFQAGKTLRRIKKEEKAAQKERESIDAAVKSGSSETVRKMASKMNPQELQEALSRIQYDTKFAELQTQQVAAGREKLAEIVAVGAKIKEAGQVMTDAYNIGAKAYNAFNKDGHQLPIIGEKASVDDLTKRFNLAREQQRFKWEQEDRDKPKEEKIDWNSELKRVQYMNAMDARNEKKAQEAAEKVLNNPQFGRASWEKATYDTSGAADQARAMWEKSAYSSNSSSSNSSNTPKTTHYTNEQRRAAYKEAVSERDRIKDKMDNSNLSSEERKVLAEEYRKAAQKAEELRG